MTATQISLNEETISKALHIVDKASETARGFFRQQVEIEFKPDQSPVTIADKTIETEIRNALKSAFPDSGILGEEHGIEGEHHADMWIIDPIDGTKSFISGHPLFGMLVGLTQSELPKLGIVGMPALAETYVGGLGFGARLNGREIKSSDTISLSEAILYINEPEKIFASEDGVFRALVNAGKTMRLSYDCYPYALLASGHVDAVVDYDLKPYDFLPVVALVQGSGGVMTDWSGQTLTMNSDGRTIAAATPQLHAELLENLAGASA